MAFSVFRRFRGWGPVEFRPFKTDVETSRMLIRAEVLDAGVGLGGDRLVTRPADQRRAHSGGAGCVQLFHDVAEKQDSGDGSVVRVQNWAERNRTVN